jgi:hypothetical protein
MSKKNSIKQARIFINMIKENKISLEQARDILKDYNILV